MLFNYALHYASLDSPLPSSIPPFPFKDGIGEYSAAYMLCNIHTSVKQHVKASLRDYTAYILALYSSIPSLKQDYT